VPRRKVQPGLLSPADAADISARLDWLEQRAVVAATGGLVLTEGPGGTVVRLPTDTLPVYTPPAFSGARVQLASGQSIPNDTATAISWPTPGGTGVTVTYDTGGYYDGAHPTRLAAPEDGYYLAGGAIRFAFNAAGDRAAQLLSATGIDTSSGCKAPATGGGNGIIYATVGVQQVGPLIAGEYVELFAYQSSGGALSTVALQTRLSLTRLR
jgi:hypothetical protein